MVLADMDPEVAFLLGPVGTLRALEHGFLTAALDLLVPAHGRFPSVPLAAMAAREKGLLAIAGPD